MKNNGLWFEEMVSRSALEYERQGLLTLRKVDPPIQQIPGTKIIIRKKSPFPDFVGCWTEFKGKGIFLECKTSSEPKIALDQESSGIKSTQIKWLKHWNMNGAAVGVLWALNDRSGMAFISLDKIKSQLAAGIKHLKFSDPDIITINQGVGFIMCDFIQALRWEYGESSGDFGKANPH